MELNLYFFFLIFKNFMFHSSHIARLESIMQFRRHALSVGLMGQASSLPECEVGLFYVPFLTIIFAVK